MHRTPLPKILLLFAFCTSFLYFSGFGQSKPAGEVDVTKCWSLPLDGESGQQLAADGDRVFLGLGQAKVVALSPDGNKIWSTELGGELSSGLLPLDAGLFLVTTTVANGADKSGSSVLRSLSKETGITNWTAKLPDGEKFFLGGFNGSVIVISDSGTIQSIDGRTGSPKWKREISHRFAAAPAFNGATVAVATIEKQILTVSLATGEIDSLRKVRYGITTLTETANGDIVAGDDRGNVSLLITGTDKPYWTFKSGGEISSILNVAGHLLVTSHDNFVYFLVRRNGGRVWKKRLPGRVSEIRNIRDQYAMISSFEEPGALLVDLENGKVAGQMVLGENESLAAPPVASGPRIFALTDGSAYGYSLTGCPPK